MTSGVEHVDASAHHGRAEAGLNDADPDGDRTAPQQVARRRVERLHHTVHADVDASPVAVTADVPTTPDAATRSTGTCPELAFHA